MSIPIKRKRPRYDTETYHRLSGELMATLDATPHLQADRDTWDLDGDWSRAGLFHFIDAQYQPAFGRFAKFDCRFVKLLNLGKPAIKITFYEKHKHWTIKHTDLTPSERSDRIDDYINGLLIGIEMSTAKLESGKISPGSPRWIELEQSRAAMREELTIFSLVRDNPDRYEVAVSNYNRNHIYTYVNWKYEKAELEFDNQQEHCLTNQKDRSGQITQMRHNVLFVDAEAILREHHYQNRTTERYLKRFSRRSIFNRDHLYVLERATPDLVQAFEAGGATAETFSFDDEPPVPLETSETVAFSPTESDPDDDNRQLVQGLLF